MKDAIDPTRKGIEDFKPALIEEKDKDKHEDLCNQPTQSYGK